MGLRLYYHAESDSYVTNDDSELAWLETADGALCVDVTGEDDHELAAVIQGVDISELDRDEPFETLGDRELGLTTDRIVDDFWDMPEPGEIDLSVFGATVETVEAHGGIAGAIAASMAKWARKPADLYPTPPDCTYSLLPHLEQFLPVGSHVLEPACADGQMSKALEEFGYVVDSTDLRPDVKYGTGGVDFLADDTYIADDYYDAIITNPPFNAAEQFIRRALQYAPVVAMLLKAQFWNTKNRKKLFRETRPALELNLTWRPAFLEAERGKSPLMDCMWVVWVRGHEGLPRVDILDRLAACPGSSDSYGGL